MGAYVQLWYTIQW